MNKLELNSLTELTNLLLTSKTLIMNTMEPDLLIFNKVDLQEMILGLLLILKLLILVITHFKEEMLLVLLLMVGLLLTILTGL